MGEEILKPVFPLRLDRIVFCHLIRGQQGEELFGILRLLDCQVGLGGGECSLCLNSRRIGASRRDKCLNLVLCGDDAYEEGFVRQTIGFEERFGLNLLLIGKSQSILSAVSPPIICTRWLNR